MRKMILVLAIVGISFAQAAETLTFGDVNYFLQKGQLNIKADLSSTYYQEASKQKNNTEETRGYQAQTRYGFGINDQMNIYLGLDFAFDRDVQDKTADPVTNKTDASYSQNGLANPVLGLNYRLMNQNQSRYNVDFGAVGSINIEDAEKGSSDGQVSQNGNFSNGRNSLELNAGIGRKWDVANEWRLTAGLIYNASGDQKILSQDGDQKVTLDSSVDAFALATYQYRPVDEFMMLLSAKVTAISELSGKVNGLEASDDEHMDLDFLYQAKYLITDTFIANFHYGISNNADYDRTFSGNSFEIHKRRENIFGLGVDFLF